MDFEKQSGHLTLTIFLLSDSPACGGQQDSRIYYYGRDALSGKVHE